MRTGTKDERYLAQQESRAKKILNGERFIHYQSHHQGMTFLKSPAPNECETCGDERRLTLSLVVFDESYFAVTHRGPSSTNVEKNTNLLVSNRPDDYRWECFPCNCQRRGGRFQK